MTATREDAEQHKLNCLSAEIRVTKPLIPRAERVVIRALVGARVREREDKTPLTRCARAWPCGPWRCARLMRRAQRLVVFESSVCARRVAFGGHSNERSRGFAP